MRGILYLTCSQSLYVVLMLHSCSHSASWVIRSVANLLYNENSLGMPHFLITTSPSATALVCSVEIALYLALEYLNCILTLFVGEKQW